MSELTNSEFAELYEKTVKVHGELYIGLVSLSSAPKWLETFALNAMELRRPVSPNNEGYRKGLIKGIQQTAKACQKQIERLQKENAKLKSLIKAALDDEETELYPDLILSMTDAICTEANNDE